MAVPCLTTAPSLDDPTTVRAKAGKISLKLTGTVIFDRAGTSVSTDEGKVSVACSDQKLSFTVVAGKSYTLNILHCGMQDNSTCDLQEDCDKATTLMTLSAINTMCQLTIVVSRDGQ